MMRNANGMACRKGLWVFGGGCLWKIFGPVVEKKQG